MKKWKLWELKLRNTSTSLFPVYASKDWIKYDVGAEEESNQEWTYRQSSLIYSFIQQKFLRIYYSQTLFWAMKILLIPTSRKSPACRLEAYILVMSM